MQDILICAILDISIEYKTTAVIVLGSVALQFQS